MTFKTQMTSDLSVFFDSDEFAETVTYNGESIEAVIDYGEDLDRIEAGDAVAAMATIYVEVSDVADPDYRDTVVIGSDTWRVRNIVKGDGYVWKLDIKRDERPVL